MQQPARLWASSTPSVSQDNSFPSPPHLCAWLPLPAQLYTHSFHYCSLWEFLTGSQLVTPMPRAHSHPLGAGGPILSLTSSSPLLLRLPAASPSSKLPIAPCSLLQHMGTSLQKHCSRCIPSDAFGTAQLLPVWSVCMVFPYREGI